MPAASTGVFYGSVVVAFFFAFGIGANDVANSFGTSVGSGALTLRRAVVIATVCEFSGAVTLGRGVSDTIVRQISRLDEAACWNCSTPDGTGASRFMLGMACALLSGMSFMLLATFVAMPVSTTHAIVGAVLGMTVVGAGASCVNWGYPGLLTIVASWFASPLAAGVLSAAMHVAIQAGVFKATKPLAVAMAALPFLYGASVATVLSLVLIKAQPTQAWPPWLTAVVTLAVAFTVAGAVQLVLVPQLQRKVHLWVQGGGIALSELPRQVDTAPPPLKLSALPYEPGLQADGNEMTGLLQQDRQERTTTDAPDGDSQSPEGLENGVEDMQVMYSDSALLHGDIETPYVSPQAAMQGGDGQSAAAEQVFMYLQVLTACLKSFAHGANDTANAAGPFAAVQSLYLHPEAGCMGIETPIWVLAFCGAGIVAGLATWGHRVMQTVGKNLVTINFSKGFAIELGSTLSVVLASVVGMPVSSTHCQIGSIVAVGIAEAGMRSIEWSVFSKIVVSWLVTVPLAAIAAALLLLFSGSVLPM